MDSGVRLNLLDRWDATPLNYAGKNKDISTLLKQNGGIFGTVKDYINVTSYEPIQSEDEVRLYYAALNDDLKAAEFLKQNSRTGGNWNPNSRDIDNRTPLHVAAS